ncbi:hypothetical protein AAHN97_12410 [Chitinophaga niabensis]|uniref:hypothetical protein n=1 Tax=Chitinophaga niabensis TaxID=536979 RepID=UPI0031B9C0D6
MSNSEKFKAAFNTIMEEFHAELKNEEISSVEFVLDPSRQIHGEEHPGPEGTKLILSGICRWNPARRRIECGRP